MERIHATDVRIADWAVRATASDVASAVPTSEPAIDAQTLLEHERRRVLDSAQEQGYASGLKRADQAIEARAKAAESQIREAHAAEGESLQLANEQLAELLQSLPQAIAQMDTRVETAAVEIAYAACMRLLGESAVNRTLMPALCEQALAEYRQRPVTVRVCATDAACLAHIAGDDVGVVVDPHLASGQCRLETHKGLYDTGIEVRLDALKQVLLHSLNQAGAAA